MFLSKLKQKNGVFKFHRFDERFRYGLVRVGLTVETKLRFQI